MAQEQVIRAKLSKAKAEMERIKSNRKITKKGRKNRTELMKDWKIISIAELVKYMEKEKSKLRNLKRGYVRRKKLEEAKRINRPFHQDPGSVFCSFKKIIENQDDTKIQNTTPVGQTKKTTKKDLTILWKQLGSGNCCEKEKGQGMSQPIDLKKSKGRFVKEFHYPRRKSST